MNQEQSSNNNSDVTSKEKKVWPKLQLMELGFIQDTENSNLSPPINDGVVDSS